MSTVKPSEHLPFRTGDGFPRVLLYLRLFFHPQGTSPPTEAQYEWCDMPSRAVDVLGHSLSFPLEVETLTDDR